MSENQVQKMTQIYNTLLMISTRGEDTMIMAECLKAFQQLIEEGAKEAGLTLSKGPSAPTTNESEPEKAQAEVVEE